MNETGGYEQEEITPIQDSFSIYGTKNLSHWQTVNLGSDKPLNDLCSHMWTHKIKHP
jgi:hypothetical protein